MDLLWRWLARVIDGILVAIVSYALIFLTDTLSNFWATGLFTGVLTFVYFVAFEVSIGSTPGKKLLGLSVHGSGRSTQADRRAVSDPQLVDTAADHSVRRWAAWSRRDHHHRGDHQRQPDQTGQARRTRRRHSGRQGLTPPRGHMKIPSSSTNTSPVTESTVSMIDHDLMV